MNIDNLWLMVVKVNEVERVINLKPTTRGGKAEIFSETDGDWVPYDGNVDFCGARELTHDELGKFERCLSENLQARTKAFCEKARTKKKGWDTTLISS